MKKSKLLAAALAATMFATAACGLVACGDNETYTVTFNADGGTLSGAATLKTDKNGIIKGAIPTAEKTDVMFNGWSLTQNATTTINFKSQKFTKNTVVYAVYKDYEVVTVTFDYGDGFGTRISAETVNGKIQSLPTPTAPAGKGFDGWYTAATGGTLVTETTVFIQDATIYARYSEEVYSNYCLVGDTKIELEELTLEDDVQAFTATVNLNADDAVSFYVDGQLISAVKGDIWLGMAPSVGNNTVFTAERAGAFEFVLSCSTGDTPTWTLTGDDGTIITLANHYYLVGEEFGNWERCLEEYYIGETSGQIDVTVGTTPLVFKVVKAADRLGAIEWGGALGIDNMSDRGIGYVTSDNDGNIVLEAAGTYTISLVGGEIEITSEDVEEREINVIAKDYYIVSKELGNWAQCVEAGHIGKVGDTIDLTVEEDAPAIFKIAQCKNKLGSIDWDTALGAGAVTVGRGYVTPDGDGNIVLKLAGTYTIKLVGGKIEITSEDVEEPELTKDIDGYTYGEVDSEKYYLVGAFIGEEYDADNGYEMNLKDNGEYMVEGFYVEAGGAVIILIGDEEYGSAYVHAQWGKKELADTDDDGNIVFKEAGYYKIYINPTTKDIYLSK